MSSEIAFEMVTSTIRYGSGVTREVGKDLKDSNLRRVMVLTDPNVSALSPVSNVLDSLNQQKINYKLFDQVRIEPTDASFQEAIRFATEGRFDAFVAIGGGSTLDTAK